MLERAGMVEVVSSLERDGRPVFRDLRWGVYVVLEAPTDYAAACFRQYGLKTDDTGRYAAMYKPYHLIGLELDDLRPVNAALRGEPTGQPRAWRGDAVAVAKRALAAGETLDGEGGYTVWGKLDAGRAASRPVRCRSASPIAPLLRPVALGAVVRWDDVEPISSGAVEVRRQMERIFSPDRRST